jgi:Tfp pilus assembly protein FimT
MYRAVPAPLEVQHPGRGLTRNREAGLGAIEMIVVAAVLALMVWVALPGLRGYQSTSAMQTTARQFVSDLRTAQQQAESVGAPIIVSLTPAAGTAVTGYSVKNGATVLWTATFPSSVHATSSWPGLAITFQNNGSTSGSAAATALCIDNTRGLTVAVTLSPATGHAALTSGTGTC